MKIVLVTGSRGFIGHNLVAMLKHHPDIAVKTFDINVYKNLVNREEMASAKDLGEYYRIPCDERDMNYGKYFTVGEEQVSQAEDYHSYNTKRLEIKEKLLTLNYVKDELRCV